MSDRPGITSELRAAFSYEMATSSRASTSASIDAGKLMDLCDAIDSVHANLEREYERLREQDRDGLIELPKDADDEVIHIDDMMECMLDGAKKVLRVGYMTYRPDGWHIALTIEENYRFQSYTPKELRHYHAPTVEDVLREFAEKITDSQIPGVHPTYEEAIAEYTQRLTLAGDAE